jgi:hypothetical protein
MTDKLVAGQIARQRCHGLYLSRQCPDIVDLSRELLGLHCWFHRNVAFSALIRGADITGWKHALTKTWLYRGTLHGVPYDELPLLLSLHRGSSWLMRHYGEALVRRVAEEVLRYMEDGVYSRAELRVIFAETYEPKVIEAMLSPWGGIFVHLAGLGQVAFRDMTSRDFDMIDAEPAYTREEALTGLFRRYLKAYGPATLEDAAWFLGIPREEKKLLNGLPLEEFERLELGGKAYYHCGEPGGMADIPEYGLLSGFDPAIVSYLERGAVLPPEYKSRVILKSGICLPTIAVHGKVAGLWNIKKNEPVIEFFEKQPKRITEDIRDWVDAIRWRTAGLI